MKVPGGKWILALVVPGIIVLGLLNGVQIASASCFIWWPGNECTCTVADSSAHFSYQQHTNYFSQDKGRWILKQVLAKPLGSNITNTGASPASVEIHEQQGQAWGSVTTDCWGDLIDEDSNGTAQLNAYDFTDFECSGSHTVTVKPNGGSCPQGSCDD